MEEVINKVLDKLPIGTLTVLAIIALVGKWLPGIIINYIKVHKELRDMSDSLKEAYITDLEKQLEILKKEIKELRKAKTND